RPADFRSVPFNQRANGRVAVHRLEHIQAGPVQPHDREIVVEGGKPPLVRMMFIGDQVGDVPGKEIKGLSREMTRFMNSNSRLHVSRETLGAKAYTSQRFACKNR